VAQVGFVDFQMPIMLYPALNIYLLQLNTTISNSDNSLHGNMTGDTLVSGVV
jgi:hypothetical protein